jgi:hypothetical protein
MGLLQDLEIDTAATPAMLVNAPDGVIAEVGMAKPRPSFASTLLTAEPTPRILWWPERESLTQPLLSRLRWMLQMAMGEAWLLCDPEDPDSVTVDEVRAALVPLGMASHFERATASGEIAVHVAP